MKQTCEIILMTKNKMILLTFVQQTRMSVDNELVNEMNRKMVSFTFIYVHGHRFIETRKMNQRQEGQKVDSYK